MMTTLRLSYAKQHGVLLQMQEHHIDVLFCVEPSLTVLTELRRQTKQPLRLIQVDQAAFNATLVKTYESTSTAAMQVAEDFGEKLSLSSLMEHLPKTEDLLDQQDDAPIIHLLNALLNEAIQEGASDVHVETFEDRISIRFRVDGVLRTVIEPPRVLAPLIISRIKVMAKLDIAEKRLPQDGRISLRRGSHTVDVRVSTIPTNHGERAVLRLLDKQNTRLDLTELGMDETRLQLLKNIIQKPHGILLVTGPTGSGKTTTLYAALTLLNNHERNILTVEDPIEYDLPGIGQTQVNTKINMTFAKGLRAILRQDPDVVMVGEIRDLETAQIAIQASLTGHFVLSTLHTNSAIGAATRLQDMGVEPFLLASSLTAVLAQRLARLLCVHCKIMKTANEAECALMGLPFDQAPLIAHPKGCEHCRLTGYAGRTGIYELIVIDEAMRRYIHENTDEQTMRHYARRLYQGLRQDGFRRVCLGDTSLEEITRVTLED